jgi:uncharacterized protein (TIGR03083 family)
VEPAGPVLVAHRFAALHAELMALLRKLGPGDWTRPTWAPLWDVRDVVAHLLDGDVRRLSLHRDALAAAPAGRALTGYRDLVAYLDELNADWVRAARRISPTVLLDLLAVTGPQVADFLRGLDPHETAHFPVAWAGEDASANWLDVGREYTERWHHQQQIREAVGAPGLVGPTWLGPVLKISMRALPFAYRHVGGAPGAAAVVIIEGGGRGHLVARPPTRRLESLCRRPRDGPGADPDERGHGLAPLLPHPVRRGGARSRAD